jgi:hypothetical protein
LLLDEHYSPIIARQLRSRGHDIAAAQERDDLRGLGDRELFRRSTAERRALMTEDVGDFIPVARQAAAAGERHFGVLIASGRSLSRRKRAVGDVIERLDEFLAHHPADDALADRVAWLSPTSD